MAKAESLFNRHYEAFRNKTVDQNVEWTKSMAIIFAACIIAEAISNGLETEQNP